MRKMDEMQMQHNLYSIRSAYAFSLIFEAIYLIYLGFSNDFKDVTSNVVFILILGQTIVYFLSNLLLRGKVGEDRSKLGIGFAIILAILAIGLGIGINIF